MSCVETPTIAPDHRRALMSSDTSRQNKLWLAEGWRARNGWFIEWRWAGTPMRSRLEFRFGPGERFQRADSFEEDVLPTYKFNGVSS